jgi:hypothetical protein
MKQLIKNIILNSNADNVVDKLNYSELIQVGNLISAYSKLMSVEYNNAKIVDVNNYYNTSNYIAVNAMRVKDAAISFKCSSLSLRGLINHILRSKNGLNVVANVTGLSYGEILLNTKDYESMLVIIETIYGKG